ncbi:type I DNA topoisomerase [Marinilongibacter aquaticus]|uniref:type I DNA topoisomerase n=1 Tax=Marinilongibacter aquaticus TaxID=2975157 RepID=UPI0021BD63BB|nr:type I DNA topoisomerase [Marinilongibacter aquaticus]UBM58843.1 type I DNA topoisomerase [Marinilongibacter aquaticus]
MSKNLVIVESPAKAKTIEGYLGKDFIVKSSFGHIRDLPEKQLGVDVEKNYEPTYEVSSDKKKVVSELKKLAKGNIVWLATDDDREGEAISWHLKEALGLDDGVKRIVFREITKNAISKAIENPRGIDIDLVNAQQARRVLDRLVGFELSPVLWKKIRLGGADRKNLSAGRVQSVAVRIIVEREREIENHEAVSSFKVSALFEVEKGKILKAELPKNFETEKEAVAFLEDCKQASFNINNLEVKPSKRKPAAPFTTSTLQQEASRKLSFSVAQTMQVAQRLYESGKITYMRTDSTNLSQEAIASASDQIRTAYGDEYLQTRQYKTKSESAQEAHEAIRPTNFSELEAGADRNQKRLYELIWKRAIASQMSDAQIERTIAKIGISTREEELTATGEVIKFDGFLKVYLESTDDEDEENSGMLPPLHVGQILDLQSMKTTERFSRPPARFTEASLVKKLEELGIGRPSTYAPTISTVIKRNYIVKEDRPGQERKFREYILSNAEIKENHGTETFGSEKAKLFPTNIGMIVNDYLVENFDEVLDYKFTAKVEDEFDDVAEGKLPWQNMINSFYQEFHQKVDKAAESEASSGNSYELGIEPKSGKKIFAKIGKYGPYIQVGESTDEDKPEFISLKKGTLIANVTLEEAMAVINGPKLPLELGIFEDQALVVNEGRYGPYILHNGKYYNLDKGEDPFAVNLERAIEIIETRRKDPANALPRDMADYKGEAVQVGKGRFGPYIKYNGKFINIKGEDPLTIEDDKVAEKIEEYLQKEKNKVIKTFPENESVQVLNGRYGPYIKIGKRNVKIPKDKKPEELTLEECLKLGES